MSNVNAISVKHLTKSYGDFKINDLNFNIPYGSIVGFIGENGAGKTTTIKSILGLCQIESGEIEILGNKAGNNSMEASYKEHIGVVFDECNFPQLLTAKDVGLIMRRIYKTWDEKKFKDYLTRFELPDNKKIKDMSKGMKMKTSIAVALSHDSQVLILDESTSGLDPVVRNEILDIFREFVLDENHAVFLSSHITSDIEKAADYIMLIHKGRVLLAAQKDELIYRYGIVKCSKEQAALIPKELIVGKEENSFEVSVLINNRKKLIDEGFCNRIDKSGITPVIDRASIEDILIYMVRM